MYFFLSMELKFLTQVITLDLQVGNDGIYDEDVYFNIDRYVRSEVYALGLSFDFGLIKK